MLAEEGLLGSLSKTLLPWTQLLPGSRPLASHLKGNAVKHRQLNDKNEFAHALLNFFVPVDKKVWGKNPTTFKLLSECAAPSTERFQKTLQTSGKGSKWP